MADPLPGAQPLMEMSRRISPRYASFLIVVVLVFALICFGAATSIGRDYGLLLIVLGAVFALSGLGLTIFLFLVRPELLRSEQYQAFVRFLEWANDPGIDEEKMKIGSDAYRALADESDSKPGDPDGGTE